MKSTLSNSVNAKMKTASHQKPLQVTPQKPEEKALTRGQHLADTLAAKVGSWPFLIGQTVPCWVGGREPDTGHSSLGSAALHPPQLSILLCLCLHCTDCLNESKPPVGCRTGRKSLQSSS